jgi:uncharacterized protein YkwD
MSRLVPIFAILMLAGWTAADEPKKDKDEFKLSKEEQEILELTNKERKDAGLSALKPNPKLFKAARDHSENMAKQGELNHTLDAKGPAERLADVGYKQRGWAENIAMGQRMPAEIVQMWMGSEMHKANMLSQHTEIGIGVTAAADGTRYWTQVFANPE